MANQTPTPKLIGKLDKRGKGNWEVGDLIIYTHSSESALSNYNLIKAHLDKNPKSWKNPNA